ncbi:Regulator of microtubule dynamics protein 2 [Armadillidium vulgare]|nr:Regulator of microtubule dynamics protein 2 [Armadillidium vulgare]
MTRHYITYFGRFCYEVSSLTWIEKKLATALYGEIPCSSYEEALEHFIAADELKQMNWKENKFYVAKCYFKIFNCEKGKSWLQRALDAPTVNADDELINKEILEMMKEFSVTD